MGAVEHGVQRYARVTISAERDTEPALVPLSTGSRGTVGR